MLKRVSILTILLLTATRWLAAQDSIPQPRFAPFDTHTRSGWITTTAVGTGLFATGSVTRAAIGNNFIPSHMTAEPGTGIIDAAQYMPLALPWIMKAFGTPTRSGWGRMAVSQGAAAVIMAGGVGLIKESGNYLRPDGSDMRSFPSGHSAWAFMGATMIAKELGGLSPWYTLGAYTFASGIAMQRVIDRRHLPCDVVAGAGIGILAAQAGYYIGDIIFGNRQLDNRRHSGTPRPIDTDRFHLSLESGMIIPMGNIHAGGTTIAPKPALSAGIKGGVSLTDRWEISLLLAMRSTPVFTKGESTDIFIAPLNAIGAEFAPAYRLPVSASAAITAELAGGYYRNFTLKSPGRAITAGKGNATGRINIGAQWYVSENLHMGASAGYEISGYRFTLSPDNTGGHTTSRESASGTAHSLLLNLSTTVSF